MNDVAPVQARPVPFRMTFSGTEAELFQLLLRGSALQIPTFGFYRFWLITDVRRHLWSHTQVGEDTFEYTGRGKELLIGFLIALAVLVPVYILYFIATLEAERLQAFASVPMVLVLYVLGYYAIFRARRYRATRTILRGVRFWMTGSGWAYVGIAILWDLLTLLTLGFAYPWRSAALERYKMRHTRYGDVAGAFSATGWTLFKRGGWLWAVFLVLAAAAGVVAVREDWVSLVLLGVVLVFSAPFLLPVFRAMELRWWLEGLRLGPVTVESDLAIRTIVGCYGKTLLAWMAYGAVASIALGFVGGIVGGAAMGLGLEAEMPDTLSVPAVIVGGLVGIITYIAFLLGLDIIRRLFLDRGVWVAAVQSAVVHNLGALETVRGTGAEQSGSLGEGLLDALDMGGF